MQRIDRTLWAAAQQAARWMWARLQHRGRRTGIWLAAMYGRDLPPGPQAAETLATLCGYRLTPSGGRGFSLPGWRHWWRWGIWYVFRPHRQASRHWTTYQVRWIEDPHEVRLVRSVLQGEAEVVPSPSVKARTAPTALLEQLSCEDVDRILHD